MHKAVKTAKVGFVFTIITVEFSASQAHKAARILTADLFFAYPQLKENSGTIRTLLVCFVIKQGMVQRGVYL